MNKIRMSLQILALGHNQCFDIFSSSSNTDFFLRNSNYHTLYTVILPWTTVICPQISYILQFCLVHQKYTVMLNVVRSANTNHVRRSCSVQKYHDNFTDIVCTCILLKYRKWFVVLIKLSFLFPATIHAYKPLASMFHNNTHRTLSISLCSWPTSLHGFITTNITFQIMPCYLISRVPWHMSFQYLGLLNFSDLCRCPKNLAPRYIHNSNLSFQSNEVTNTKHTGYLSICLFNPLTKLTLIMLNPHLQHRFFLHAMW